MKHKQLVNYDVVCGTTREEWNALAMLAQTKKHSNNDFGHASRWIKTIRLENGTVMLKLHAMHPSSTTRPNIIESFTVVVTAVLTHHRKEWTEGTPLMCLIAALDHLNKLETNQP